MKILEVSGLYRHTPPTGAGSIEKFVHMLCENILLVHDKTDLTVMAKKGSTGGTYNLVETDFENYEEDIINTIEELKPDVIHLHFDNVSIHKKLSQLKIPIVYTIHSYSEPCQWLEILEESRNQRHVYFTFVSDYFKQYFISVLKEKNIEYIKENFITTWIGIDLEYILRNQKHTYPKEYSVYLGLIRKHKAVLEIVQAFSEIEQKLVVVGPVKNIEYCDHVLELIEKYPNIKYLGEIGTEKERLEIFSKAKALIIATGYSKFEPDCHEAFGTVMVEANASGIPVIGYNQGVMTTFIEEGVNGYKFKDIRQIESILDKTDQKQMQKACIQKAKPFGIKNVGETYFKTLKSIVTKGNVDINS